MSRYDKMHYNRCGLSGLLLPTFSLGLWHNFGEIDDYQNAKELVHLSFDQGITHFDLANNYGPPPGSAEITFGRILKEGLMIYRDELIISSKAGWPMWDGPYGDWGSKKHLMASLEQSLKRMQIDYVDIFYHHRPDPNTPLEESMRTLDLMVRQGKALYVGISSYDAAETKKAVAILNDLGTPCLIHQPKYSMLDRWVEDGLLDVLDDEGVGCITFSSLAQGLLTNRYINGIPKDSRAASGRGNGAIESGQIQPNEIALANALNEMAQQRGQSLAQMALAWVLKDKRITSVLLGVSRKEQLLDSLKALEAGPFSQEELTQIDQLLKTHS
ncbi:MAG: aldo/keto reductase [Flavobacteriaceae bacterium]|jgi:L-glyceraldehyde 3-phosphate reductase|nr:aldo/keto reductase [Flavobacteriaceae bacterium]